ncbi:hypothetical protein QA942_09615 [Streptomyces sp. B21-106]|uniref:hypothetical protein n=1 Tax=Streptomyces sp. B21-106 TaxID=3039418 RepID=UPI002FF2273F
MEKNERSDTGERPGADVRPGPAGRTRWGLVAAILALPVLVVVGGWCWWASGC